MTIKLITCIGTDKNISNPNLLYHFIEYYSDLGITNWSLTLHSSENSALNNLPIFVKILNDYRIPYQVWKGEYDDVRRVTMNNILIARHNLEDWFIGADFDEFIEFPCSIPEYLTNLDQQEFNCVTADLIDYIGVNGELPEIQRDIPLKKQFTLEFDIRKDIDILWEFSKYDAIFRQKKIALKKPLQWWIGRHDINEKNKSLVKESPERLKISHYPWDSLRLKRIEKIYQDTLEKKPIIYSEEEYFVTQKNRLTVIKYLQKYGKFYLN